MQVLAHLTRLRLACCNPALVAPGEAPPSSKMRAFAEILDELRRSGHKVLVFSQFVRHLRLIEDRLKRAGVPYQYLDGSTPAKSRAKRIAAFQAGLGDAFLISTRAGGVGLNLTAADYVIHMDPWWNPAVEDQASDRAHRIGQTRARHHLQTGRQGHDRGTDRRPPPPQARPRRPPARGGRRPRPPGRRRTHRTAETRRFSPRRYAEPRSRSRPCRRRRPGSGSDGGGRALS